MEVGIPDICQAGEILEGPAHLSFSTRSQAANSQDKLIYYISQGPIVKSSNLNSPRQLPSGLKEVNMMVNFANCSLPDAEKWLISWHWKDL